MIDYQLIRSNRRTLSICVDQEGALVVRAPLFMPVREIEAFLLQKQSWIEAKQRQSHPPFVMRDGAKLPVLDGSLTLRLADVPAPIERAGELILPQNGGLHAWRRQKAQKLLPPKVAYWEQQLGIRCEKLSFGSAKKRWGSMNSKGEMRLNTALIHCPTALCDYVIVHELCHRAHPDHSPAFHALVRRYLPDEKARREAMRQYGWVLLLR